MADTLAVGDGANDLDMIQAAGLGVAYRAKPVLAGQADARLDTADLTALLYFQGYGADVSLRAETEVHFAPAADGGSHGHGFSPPDPRRRLRHGRPAGRHRDPDPRPDDGTGAEVRRRRCRNAVFQRMVGLPNAASDAVARAHFGPDFPLEAFYGEVEVRVHAACEAGVALKAGVRRTARPPRRRPGSPGHRHLLQPRVGPAAPSAPAGSCRASTRSWPRGDYARGKPNPDPFLVAAERLGVPPDDCLALEDSHNGVRAAHAAGMMTVMVPDLLDPTEEMHDLCVAIAETLHHVRDLVHAHGGPPGLAR